MPLGVGFSKISSRCCSYDDCALTHPLDVIEDNALRIVWIIVNNLQTINLHAYVPLQAFDV